VGAPISPRNFVSTARLKDPRARGGCAWSRGNERRLQWIQSRRLREASLEVHLCASRAARLLYGASAWMRWHLFGACFVIAHFHLARGQPWPATNRVDPGCTRVASLLVRHDRWRRRGERIFHTLPTNGARTSVACPGLACVHSLVIFRTNIESRTVGRTSGSRGRSVVGSVCISVCVPSMQPKPPMRLQWDVSGMCACVGTAPTARSRLEWQVARPWTRVHFCWCTPRPTCGGAGVCVARLGACSTCC